MRREWIGRLDFDPATSDKIRHRHNLTDEQVRSAVAFGRAERAVYQEHTPYGPRLYVWGTSEDGVALKAALAPVDREDGHWECKTAYRQ